MKWRGKEIETFGELMDIVVACKDRREAQDFMAVYRLENPMADENIGYLSGYYDDKTAARIQDWCGVMNQNQKEIIMNDVFVPITPPSNPVGQPSGGK